MMKHRDESRSWKRSKGPAVCRPLVTETVLNYFTTRKFADFGSIAPRTYPTFVAAVAWR